MYLGSLSVQWPVNPRLLPSVSPHAQPAHLVSASPAAARSHFCHTQASKPAFPDFFHLTCKTANQPVPTAIFQGWHFTSKYAAFAVGSPTTAGNSAPQGLCPGSFLFLPLTSNSYSPLNLSSDTSYTGKVFLNPPHFILSYSLSPPPPTLSLTSFSLYPDVTSSVKSSLDNLKCNPFPIILILLQFQILMYFLLAVAVLSLKQILACY